MLRTPSFFLLFYFFLTSYGISRPRRGLAPSLVLDRLYSLRDSVEKLQQMNDRRCVGNILCYSRLEYEHSITAY
ncbi:hypothetical protein ANCDUO_18342 [Ancylostoma duodenale]|uniref:Uncharacterized protein n=1 Tax=Ancylostoma duodenale TaxID=51022 RepID=A0A0C2G3A0_9BILA|nr:hypothetical protein ANCDUO_18342 [Ancylostoma duodenale]